MRLKRKSNNVVGESKDGCTEARRNQIAIRLYCRLEHARANCPDYFVKHFSSSRSVVNILFFLAKHHLADAGPADYDCFSRTEFIFEHPIRSCTRNLSCDATVRLPRYDAPSQGVLPCLCVPHWSNPGWQPVVRPFLRYLKSDSNMPLLNESTPTALISGSEAIRNSFCSTTF